MSKAKRVLATVTVIIVIVAVFFVSSMAMDMREIFRNKDADYEFAHGPGGDISPPPPDDYLLGLVEWEEDDEEDLGEPQEPVKPANTITYVIDPNRVNVLLVGIDSPEPGRRRAPLSDSIMIFSFHKDTGNPVLISIPRDTYVMIPGRYKDKINHSHAFGGVALLRRTVEEFTGIPIHYYLRVNFEGFAGIVDMLGGVEIFVDRDIYHLKKGTQVLNGADALAFCRFRSEPRGDFARVERQQKFLLTTAKQIQREALYKLPALVKEGVQLVDTDMPLLTALDFANELNNMDPDSVRQYVVTGKGFRYNRVYYLEPKVGAMREFIFKYMTGD